MTDGLEADLRVSGATFIQGNEPTAVASGPTVSVPQTSVNAVQLGQINVKLSGQLSDDAAAVAFHLEGDIGYWTQAAGAGDITNLGFSAALSFSPNAAISDAGTLVVDISAIDSQGHFGPPTAFPFNTIPGFPAGANLVVSLNWDTESDLDLHVITPDGTEIWSQKRSEYVPPTYPKVSAPPTTIKNYYGYLDFDSNAQCVIDGRREENAVWQVQSPDGGPNPPLGHYVVRVDDWSLCGTQEANYQVNVYYKGEVIEHIAGVSLPFNTRPPHGAGAGITVLSFDISPDGGTPDGGLTDGGS
jgi:hypothetical protein